MQLNWRNKKLQTWKLYIESVLACLKQKRTCRCWHLANVYFGWVCCTIQTNKFNQKPKMFCARLIWWLNFLLQNTGSVAFQSSNWAQMFSWMWSIFAYSKLLLDLVFLSTHSTVTEMNPVNCVSLTVFYQSYQCNFYRPTETFGFILFKKKLDKL